MKKNLTLNSDTLIMESGGSVRSSNNMQPLPIQPPSVEIPALGFRRAPRIRISSDSLSNPPKKITIKPPMPKAETNPRFRLKKIPESSRAPRMSINRLPNAPISPYDALEYYSNDLTPFEKIEILNFPEIYFIGNKSQKIPEQKSFDDPTHNYRVREGDHLAYRYEILSILGSGAFGTVVKAFDQKNKVIIAIKIIINTPQMHEQAKIEASILTSVGKADPQKFVRAFEFFVFRNHFCITYECLGPSLRGMRLSPKTLKGVAVTLFGALSTMQRLGVIHCDIKPDNILTADGGRTKLIDFGASCVEGRQTFEYIQSRHYRAPEVILGAGYSFPMDTWSAALVLVEMATGRPLFPGRNMAEMLKMFIEVLWLPPASLLRRSKHLLEYFDQTGRPRFPVMAGSRTLGQAIGGSDMEFVDLIARCLRWEPRERISPDAALSHPWLKDAPSMLPELRTSANGLKAE